MGGKLTLLENRTYYNVEMRWWVYPSRPDRFNKVVKIGPERSIVIKPKYFNIPDPDHHASLVMVYANGMWTGKCIFPLHLKTYAKVICDRNHHGHVVLRGLKRPKFFSCSTALKFSSHFAAKYVGMKMVEEDL